jgi:hypothetical protein
MPGRNFVPLWVNFAIGRTSVAGANRKRAKHMPKLPRDGSRAQVNRNGWAVALVAPPVRVPQHSLSNCEPASFGLDVGYVGRNRKVG